MIYPAARTTCALSARDPLLEGFFNLFVTDIAGSYAEAWMGTWGKDVCDSLL